MTNKEYTFINLFRSTAAFWVLAAHVMIWGGWYGIPLPSAKIAVDLFMMISGYLMAANAAARTRFEPLTNVRNWFLFWLRRFFRLAPAYYLSLAVAILSSSYFLLGYHELQSLNPERWSAGGVYDPARIEYTLGNIMFHLSFLFGLHPSYSYSTFLPDWSLSLEMQFYFVFPVLFIALQRFGYIRIAILFGLPVYVIGLSIAMWVHFYEPSLIFMKLNYFIAGILLFRLLIEETDRYKRVALTLCAVLLVSIEYRYRTELVALPLLLFSMLFLGWMEVSNRTPGWIKILVNSRIIRFASDTSYGVYLFHGFFISASGLIISGNSYLLALTPPYRVLVMFLFVIVLSYLTAFAVYRFVELPGIQLGKRTIEKWRC